MSFKLLYDLGPLSNQDRETYLRDIGRHIGLPDNHTLSLIWMDTDGCRNLVPYVRRADAEVLRGIHGINVLSLTYVIDPHLNQVIFTAIGKDKNGRQEVAIGTHSNEGLKGERLAYAIMTASTRALRRLTLQFVGAGLLDESEVNMHVLDTPAAPQGLLITGGPLVLPPPPVEFKPTNEPGKDITATVLPSSATAFNEVKSNVEEDIKPPKRTRRKRGTVDIASPGQQVEMPAGLIDNKGEITPLPSPQVIQINQSPVPIEVFHEQYDPKNTVTATVTLPTVLAVPEKDTSVSEKGTALTITKEKYDAYRKRLSAYHNDILPTQGKMVNSDGIGGSTMKMRLFCHQVFGTPIAIVEGTKDTKSYTEAEWDELFAFLDSYVQKNGAVGLVEHINKTIGAV